MCAAAFYAAAAPASASTVSVATDTAPGSGSPRGTRLIVEESPPGEANNIVVTQSQSAGTTVITDTAGVQPSSNSNLTGNCVAETTTRMSCPGIHTLVWVRAGALNDSVALALEVPASAGQLSVPTTPNVNIASVDTVEGGGGDDMIDASRTVNLSSRPMVLDGDDGANLVIGSPGKDTIDVAAGTNTVQAGAGDDTVVGQFPGTGILNPQPAREDGSTDVIACGEGIDRAAPGRGDSLKIDCEKMAREVLTGSVRCGCKVKVASQGKTLGVQRRKGRPLGFISDVNLNVPKAAALIAGAASIPATFEVRIVGNVRGKRVKRSGKVGFFLTP